MKRNEAFPSKWLRKEDVLQPIRATIARVTMTDVGTDEEPQQKPAMWFNEGVAPMTINSGNWDTLEGLYGDDSDLWLGKVIEIYVDPDVKYAGRRVGGIRLREPAAARAGAPPSSNGNADTTRLLKRWEQLWSDAQSLGLKVEPLPGNPSAEIIIERGKQLKVAIEKAKVF